MRARRSLMIATFAGGLCLLGCRTSQPPQMPEQESAVDTGCAADEAALLTQSPEQPSVSPDQPAAKVQVLFYDDVQAIFTSPDYKCETCHRTQYNDPKEVKRKWNEVYASLDSGFMPRGFKRVTPQDMATLRQWEANGFPETAADTTPIAPSHAPADENCAK